MSAELIVGNSFSLTPTTLDEAMKFSEMICNSAFCPKEFKGKSGDVLVAIQMGTEVGLPAMQALQNIAVINGRPCIWGDALPALAKAHPHYESMDESFDESTMTATCTIKRKGEAAQTKTFSQADATLANLWKKAGPWTNYPKRMLQMRARGFAIRDVFPDALKGLNVAEEVQDYEIKDMGNAQVVANDEPAREVEPELLPVYTDEQFLENFPKWKQTIEEATNPENRQNRIDRIINMVGSKYSLTESQLDAIKGVI